MSDAKRQLKPANENPWYVLMTWYGEQKGEETDWKLHWKNMKVWNSWACQALDDARREELAERLELNVSHLRDWDDRKADVERRFEAEWKRRNGGQPCPGIPDIAAKIDMSEIAFSNAVLLDQAVFASDVCFDHSEFNRRASFHRAYFQGSARFKSASFSKGASFEFVTFCGPAVFRKARFANGSNFYTSTFEQYTYFIEATFGSENEEPDITTSSKNEEIKETSFSFVDCHLQKLISFRKAEFKDTYPIFDGTIVHDRAIFTAKEKNWPTREQRKPDEARTSCAAIRHALNNQGLPEDEHFFFRKEMHFAGRPQLKADASASVKRADWWRRLPFRFFHLVSDYGNSIIRPLTGLFALWIIPALIYMVYFNWVGYFYGGMDDGKGNVIEIGCLDSISLSFAAMFKFLGLQSVHFGAEYIRALHWSLELLTALQTLGGIILLFFLGLGLRTRFRLR